MKSSASPDIQCQVATVFSFLMIIYKDLYILLIFCNCYSIAKSCPTPWNSINLQLTRLPCPSLSPWVCSNSCPLNQWCHPTIASSVVPFSSCPQSFPALGSFPMSQLFTSGGPSPGASPSASFLLMNIQGWFPLGLTGLFSLQSKGLSTVFSSTTIQKHFPNFNFGKANQITWVPGTVLYVASLFSYPGCSEVNTDLQLWRPSLLV